MSRRAVDVAQRWIEAYNTRAFDRLLELTAPDIEFRSHFAGIESGGVFRGYPGVAEYFKAIDDAYERFHVVPDEFVDGGAAVVVVAHADWRGRGSGAEARTPIFPVIWLRSSRVLRVETFVDRATALDAAGIEAGDQT